MSGASTVPRTRVWPRPPRMPIAARVNAAGGGVACAALALAGGVLLLALILPLALFGYELGVLANPPSWARGGGHLAQSAELRVIPLAGLAVSLLLLPAVLRAIRRLAGTTRRLSGQCCGAPVAGPYPPGGPDTPRPGFRAGYRLLTEAATWRDVAWLVVNLCVGWALALAPAALLLAGVINLVTSPGPFQGRAMPVWVRLAGMRYLTAPALQRPDYFLNTPVSLALLGVVFLAAGLWAAPWLLRGYNLLACSLLGPTRRELALRASDLARTRSEAIDAGAAEMRRIERDLHDGAQARLVAMGMTLDAASHLLTANPAAARALVLEARDSSARALAELRDLVRGIHPPVLADRGLADAVRALALDTPVPTEVAAELTGRLPAPVESAAYFAVSELLANVAKHARAGRAWIDLRHEGGILRIGVTDDGRGGADPAGGSGLRGIERRLAAFDGVLAVGSPPGGPTTVTMEIPCPR